jgi:hypothetical protein
MKTKQPLVEWGSITVTLDERDAAGLGHTARFTVAADGSWTSLDETWGEQFGWATMTAGTLERWELKRLDKLLDIVNREPVPDETTRISRHVPDDTSTMVLNNPGDSVTLFENRDERAAQPGACLAFDDRHDIAETALVGLLMHQLGEKYAGDDFLF